ncbi:unnamed protein product [Polarella glacialis]|uniref:Uncharacterized protein n=1 Tax=Polarella glacialis TaxID=89957 RepID=A0A813KKS9_POLGL|nr:unnamed protein product [Polarella glacialis]CAE8706278.1 unnamed protein product [Polarella glacialis]
MGRRGPWGVAPLLLVLLTFWPEAMAQKEAVMKVAQHVCCTARGPLRKDVLATLPEAYNHSAIREVECVGIDGVEHIKRMGTACSYCLCLFDDGADFRTAPDCCSLNNFGTPGMDFRTGYPICQKYKATYNLASNTVRSCELRYDLYPFLAAASPQLPGLAHGALLAATVLAATAAALSQSGAYSD